MGTQRRPVVHAAWQAEGEVDGADGVRLATLSGTNELGRSSTSGVLHRRRGDLSAEKVGLGLPSTPRTSYMRCGSSCILNSTVQLR